ncbi:MAG: hypothetical protein ACRDNW_22175 [Trebonia sp.]
MLADSVQTRTRTGARRATTVERLAGAGGIAFVALIVIQNIVRASGPSFTASPASVTSYFADHRVAALLPLALFPLGMVAILGFAAGIWTRAHDAGSRFWAGVGCLAVAAIAALFSLVNIIEIAIAVKGGDLAASPRVVTALWTVHSAAFGLNLTAIALALVGLSRVAVATGLIPRALARTALLGAACLFVAAVFTVAIAEGGKWLYLGYLGFVIWGVFLLVTGVSLFRGRPASTLATTEDGTA